MAHALACPLLDQPDRSGKGALTLGANSLEKFDKAAATPAVSMLPAPPQNVVPLFGGPEDSCREDFHDDPDEPAPDWSTAFQLIRDVGAQVRLERDRAQTIVQQSQSLIQGIIAQAEEAELRAEAAMAAAADAVLRADRAEVLAGLAEERAQQAEDRAVAAQAGEKEAQLWLRRLHAHLKFEYDSLITVPEGAAVGERQPA